MRQERDIAHQCFNELDQIHHEVVRLHGRATLRVVEEPRECVLVECREHLGRTVEQVRAEGDAMLVSDSQAKMRAEDGAAQLREEFQHVSDLVAGRQAEAESKESQMRAGCQTLSDRNKELQRTVVRTEAHAKAAEESVAHWSAEDVRLQSDMVYVTHQS